MPHSSPILVALAIAIPVAGLFLGCEESTAPDGPKSWSGDPATLRGVWDLTRITSTSSSGDYNSDQVLPPGQSKTFLWLFGKGMRRCTDELSGEVRCIEVLGAAPTRKVLEIHGYRILEDTSIYHWEEHPQPNPINGSLTPVTYTETFGGRREGLSDQEKSVLRTDSILSTLIPGKWYMSAMVYGIDDPATAISEEWAESDSPGHLWLAKDSIFATWNDSGGSAAIAGVYRIKDLRIESSILDSSWFEKQYGWGGYSTITDFTIDSASIRVTGSSVCGGIRGTTYLCFPQTISFRKISVTNP